MNRKNCTTEKLFDRLLNNKTDKTTWDYIKELRSRGTKDVFDKAVELADSNVLKEKIIGINILAQLGSEPRPFLEKTLELYFQLLDKTTHPKVISAILYAIGHNNSNLTDVQIAHLIVFYNHKNSEIRRSLVSALLCIDKGNAINTLMILTNDRITAIRDWATFGIGTQSERDNEQIRATLWKRVLDKDQTTRFEAIVGLAKRQDAKIKEVIKKEFLTGEFGTLLCEAIELLKDKDFIPLIEKELAINKNDKEINKDWLNALQECLDNLKRGI